MRLVAVVLIVLFASGGAMADPSREDKVAYVIETEDFRGQIVAYQEEMAKRFAEQLSTISPVMLSEKQKNMMREEVSAIGKEYVDDYIKEVVSIYLKTFTDDEIDGIYNFYRSPEGISLGSKLPEVWRKIFWIDARYLEMLSERAMARIAERLKEEGYK